MEEFLVKLQKWLYLKDVTDIKNYRTIFIVTFISLIIVTITFVFIVYFKDESSSKNDIWYKNIISLPNILSYGILLIITSMNLVNFYRIKKSDVIIGDPTGIIDKIEEVSKAIIDDRKTTHAKLREFILQLTNLNFLKSYDLFKNILENGVISTEASQGDHFKKFLDFSGKFKQICNISDKELKNINDGYGATLLCVVSNENYFDKPEDVTKLLRYFIKNRQQFQDEVQRIFSIPGVTTGDIIKYNGEKEKAKNLYKLLKINEILGFRTFLQIYDPSASASDLKFIKGADYVLYIPFNNDSIIPKSELFLSDKDDKVVATDDAFIIEFARNDYYHRRNKDKSGKKHFIELLNSKSDAVIRQRLNLNQNEANYALQEIKEIAKKLRDSDPTAIDQLEPLSNDEIEIAKKFDSIKTEKNMKANKV